MVNEEVLKQALVVGSSRAMIDAGNGDDSVIVNEVGSLPGYIPLAWNQI
jgi:hypothetical protein